MKARHNLTIILAFLMLNACSQDLVKPHATQAGNNSGTATPADKQSLCQSNPAAVNCADTVTATFDAQGTLWIVWASAHHLYIQSSTDQGRHFSEPVKVNAEAENIAANGEYRPKIKLDQQGHIYLTWTQALEKRHTGHIRFSRSSDHGKTFSKPVTINDNLDIISHRFDDLLIGNNGEIFIAWLDARDKEQAKAAQHDFLGTAVYYSWSHDGGAHFSANKTVSPHSCECCRIGIALDRDNLPVVLWRHVFDGQIRDQALIKFKDWNTPGELKRASVDNWKIEACPHHGPALTIDDNGRYHIAWFSGATDHQGLFYSYSDDQGKNYSAAYPLGNQGAKHPHIAVLGNQVAIIWSEFDGTSNLIRGIHSDDNGESWSEPKTIGSTKNKADYGFLLTDGDDIYLSWQTDDGYQFRAIN